MRTADRLIIAFASVSKSWKPCGGSGRSVHRSSCASPRRTGRRADGMSTRPWNSADDCAIGGSTSSIVPRAATWLVRRFRLALTTRCRSRRASDARPPWQQAPLGSLPRPRRLMRLFAADAPTVCSWPGNCCATRTGRCGPRVNSGTPCHGRRSTFAPHHRVRRKVARGRRRRRLHRSPGALPERTGSVLPAIVVLHAIIRTCAH